MVEKENDVIATAAVSAAKSTENNVAGEHSTSNSPSNAGSPPNKSDLLKVLAFQFFEAYYTKLSDHPDDIGTFYGDDSSFVLGDVEEIGRENIQRAIGRMNFGDCKSRFYSVKTAPELGDSCKVFQVCGELTLKGQPAPRRFCQTIVLSCVPPNVLYVKSNIFQWLDVAFPMNSSEKVYFISPPTTIPPPATGGPVENGISSKPIIGAVANVIAAAAKEQALFNRGGSAISKVGRNQNVVVPCQAVVSNVLAPKAEIEPVVIVQTPPPGLENVIENSAASLPLTAKSPLPVNGTSPPLKKMDVLESEPQVKTPPTVENVKTAEEKTNNHLPSFDSDEESRRQQAVVVVATKQSPPQSVQPPPLPHQQQQKPSSKPEQPKSWNKVVSDGQNKVPTNVGVVVMPPPTQAAAAPAPGGGSKGGQNAAAGGNAGVGAKKVVQERKQQSSPPQPFSSDNNSAWSSMMSDSAAVGGQLQQQKHSPPTTRNDEDGQKKVQHQNQGAPTTGGGFVAPRREWPHRIYFNNLSKPGHFVDFKAGQRELMKELLGITDGVEFVGIKPLSLRKEYKFAFGFVDFTTTEDMQAIYDACKKSQNRGGSHQLRVCIPTFEFDGLLTLTADKTNNLYSSGGNNNSNGGGGGGQKPNR